MKMKKNVLKWLPVALGLLATGCSTDNDGMVADYMYESVYKNGDLSGMIMPGGEGGKFDAFKDNPFVKASEQPVSTFSVDADGASYGIMRNYLSSGYWDLSPSSVRIEEFLNYFTFDYPSPSDGNAIAINAEVGPCPWNPSHHLLRLGIKGKELKEGEVPQANYVFLVDVSGSMDGRDRLDLLKKGLKELLYQLSPTDRISIITYSGTVKKLLESTPVSEADKIRDAIDRLSASGSTAGGKALEMAYEEALANYDPGKNNRIIMGTDGDFNVGVTSKEALVEMVENYARKGIYLTCLGFGMGNLNDAMMEQISNKGNGTYHYIDCEDEIMKVFVHERERFVSVANDVKCQVTFNADVVESYRLIGYENRVMENEDFENDEKDAAEIGAGQTITALYEVETSLVESQAGDLPLVTFDCRYKPSLSAESIPLQKTMTTGDVLTTSENCSPDFRFAAGVAAYGMLLRKSPYKGDANYALAKELVSGGLSYDPHGYRSQLLKLMEIAAEKDSQRTTR